MGKISIEINDDLYCQAESIFVDAGIDSDTAIKMFFKRVVNEGSFAFLLQNRQGEKEDLLVDNVKRHMARPRRLYNNESSVEGYVDRVADIKENGNFDRIRKGNAVRLLRSKGYDLYDTITFASKNTGAYNYWANPDSYYTKHNWSLILNDWKERKLYLFNIPANSISDNMIVVRADKPDKIDLQIMYNDVTFTDNRSGISFAKFFVGEVKY